MSVHTKRRKFNPGYNKQICFDEDISLATGADFAQFDRHGNINEVFKMMK